MVPAADLHRPQDRAVLVPVARGLALVLQPGLSGEVVMRRGSIRLVVADQGEQVLAELAGLAVEVPGSNENLGNTAGV